MRNTTLPLIKYGVQSIRTTLKSIWRAPNYFIIQPLGGRLTSCKMASNGEEKAFCVLHFHVSRSVLTVKREFRTRFKKKPPAKNSIRSWYDKLQRTGCLCKGKSPGRPLTSEATLERVREAFQRSSQKSTARANRELGIPQTTVWRVLRKRLQMYPYRLMMLQHLRREDHTKHLHFCVSFQDLCGDDNFLKTLRFSDEATFHVSWKANKQNILIWGTEKAHRIVENERDSPKTNVVCAISTSKVYGPYFFPDITVNGETFRNMLTTWLMPQLEHDSADFVYQLDGAPCHYHRNVMNFLNETLPLRCIGRAVNNDQYLLLWPPRSPDLTTCDFFPMGIR